MKTHGRVNAPTVRTSRRTVLCGAGTAALTLPFLRVLEGTARAAPAPRRIVFFATPNGTNLPTYWPSDWNTLSPILSPLEPLKAKLVVTRGIDAKTSEKRDPAGNLPRNHALSYPDMLTGWQPPVPPPPGYGGPVDHSLDQAIARTVGGQTKFRSLELAVQADRSNGFWLLARGPGQILFPENSPAKIYQSLFADLALPGSSSGPDPQAQKLLASRKSMLDFVRADLARLRCALGTEERPKFDAHLGAVRDLEESLTFTATASGPGCARPGQSPGTDFRATGKNQMDLIVRAFACDLTRVVSLQWGGGASNTVYDWLGLTKGHHAIAHYRGVGLTAEQAAVMTTKIETWFAQQFFYLCDQLNRITDVDGRTLLDNTAVVWLHEQQDGFRHGMRDMPWVIAGSCGGFFKTGQMVRFNGVAHNRMLLTLARAMGLSATSFGDPAFAGPVLSEIVA